MTRIGRCILFALLLLFPLSALAQDLSEKELSNKADEALSRNDYPAAIAALDQSIKLFPESKNEQNFQSLTRLSDSYGIDFEKAVEAYRLYSVRFPNGRFQARFRERLEYLESRRADWPAIQRFIQLQSKFDRKNPGPSVQEAEKLLQDFPNATIKPDIWLWLGIELSKAEDYPRAKNYLDSYLAGVHDDKNHVDRVKALVAYIEVATKLKDYGAAEQKLDEIRTIEPRRHDEFQPTLDKIRFKRRSYYTFLASVLIACAAILAAMSQRPWKSKNFSIGPKQFVRQLAIMVAVSLGPLGLLLVKGEKVPTTFWALAGFGCVGLLFIKLASPLHARIGRTAYLLISALFISCLVYVAFYLTDTAKVFLWPIEEIQRHG